MGYISRNMHMLTGFFFRGILYHSHIFVFSSTLPLRCHIFRVLKLNAIISLASLFKVYKNSLLFL